MRSSFALCFASLASVALAAPSKRWASPMFPNEWTLSLNVWPASNVSDVKSLACGGIIGAKAAQFRFVQAIDSTAPFPFYGALVHVSEVFPDGTLSPCAIVDSTFSCSNVDPAIVADDSASLFTVNTEWLEDKSRDLLLPPANGELFPKTKFQVTENGSLSIADSVGEAANLEFLLHNRR